MPVQRDVLAPLWGLRRRHLEWLDGEDKENLPGHMLGKKDLGRVCQRHSRAETSSGWTMVGV